MIQLTGISTPPGVPPSELRPLAARRLRVPPGAIRELRVVQRSIDARDRDDVRLVYTLEIDIEDERRLLARPPRGVRRIERGTEPEVVPGNRPLSAPPVVVGAGPAGLFAALTLARHGYAPQVIERGQPVAERTAAVNRFWASGALDPESNVAFGEGGAGTFSDGKLTTRIRDPRCHAVLCALVEAGAPPEIEFLARPHVGTDLLRRVVTSLRHHIEALGGRFRFSCRLDALRLEDGRLAGLVTGGGEELKTGAALLAIGHSARDTYRMLADAGLAMAPKAFSLGVRIEHPQPWLDRARYGRFAGHPDLGPADYQLVHHAPTGRSAYTFCMCPGGEVIAAATEAGGVVTNGMSFHSRTGKNSNAALLVGVTPADYPPGAPAALAGLNWQRTLERQAFVLGGGGFAAPAQTVGDFLARRPSRALGTVPATYRPGVTPADFDRLFPDWLAATLRQALVEWDRQIPGFAAPDALLTAVESRSSAPLRLLRNDACESSLPGLYVAGEGAGYAGGIVSSAVDGIRAAEGLISAFAPLR